MKKKIVITLSRVFPTTHSRKGKFTYFEENLILGVKKHTIRGNYDLWKSNVGKLSTGKYYLSIRQWSGKPYKSHQLEIAQVHKPIGIQSIELYYHSLTNSITIFIDGFYRSDSIELLLARNDGLSVADFREWFFGKKPKGDKVFKGVIIHFTNFRY